MPRTFSLSLDAGADINEMPTVHDVIERRSYTASDRQLSYQTIPLDDWFAKNGKEIVDKRS